MNHDFYPLTHYREMDKATVDIIQNSVYNIFSQPRLCMLMSTHKLNMPVSHNHNNVTSVDLHITSMECNDDTDWHDS